MFMLVPAVFVLENSFLQVNQFRCKRPKNEEVLWTILWTILFGSDWHFYRYLIFAINCNGGQMFPSETVIIASGVIRCVEN